jgi:ATP-binding cassette, subfamily B, multidrug efflux pump
MKQILRLKSFVKPYWKESVFSLFLLTAVVFMDLAIPRLIQRIVDQGIVPGNFTVVRNTTLIMLGISLLDAVFAVGNNILSIKAGEGFARDLREAMFLKIQSFSFGNLDRLRTGELIVRLTSDVTALQRMVQVFLRIGTRAPLLMIGSLILMFNTNQKLALTLLPLLAITGGMIYFFISKAGPLFRTIQKKLDRLNTVLQENISGVRVVKAFVRAAHEQKRFDEANADFTSHTIGVMKLFGTMFPTLTIFINIGLVIVVWAGGLQAIQGSLTVGEIIAFLNYLMTTIFPLMILAMISNVLAGAMVSAERVHEVLDVEPEVQEMPGAAALPLDSQPRLAFEQVSFHYNGSSDEQVLKDIVLKAEPGETIAILGATGAGKSTLINLIPRFYDASAGRVLFDGMDVRELKQDDLLAQVAMVPQESVLFAGTVHENIRYGKPDASDEEVIEAAKAAQAHDFILELPDGYDTRVEQRGMNLSGGQKQRIAIARALLTQPKVLIMDDSTSSVDVETETKIQDAFERMRKGCTNIVVAQRISTVLNADKIVVIDKGQIAAVGKHQELIQTSPIYQEIYDSQLGNGFVQPEPEKTLEA